MYVYLDTFDYPWMVELIQNVVGEDVPLTTEIITDVLTKMVDRINSFKTIEDEITEENFLEHIGAWMLLWNDGYNLLYAIPEQFTEYYDEVLHCSLTPEPKYERLLDILSVKFDVFDNPDGSGRMLDVDLSQLTKVFNEAHDWIVKTKFFELTYDEHRLREGLRLQLLQGTELDTVKFNIYDIPGQTIKYGNALITFPLILAKVTHYET